MVGYQLLKRKSPKRIYAGIQDVTSITVTSDTVTYLEGQEFFLWENKLKDVYYFDSFAKRKRNKLCTDKICVLG
jgi:hypothetical protein